MRQDIVKLLEAEKDVTNVIVLTHNIDFVFIQSVVLPALRRCGHPSLTIFADAQCAAESYQHQHMVLDSLGLRFRVVPVAMRPGFRFHPKAILLSGQKKGVLLVGSGNLTFGGWRENAEIWCRYDSDVDGTSQFSAFLGYLGKIVGLTALRGYLEPEVNECFDGRLRPWALDMDPPSGLMERPGTGTSLIEQMQAALQDKLTTGLLIHSPYFDDGGVALGELSTRFKVRTRVAAQWKRSGLQIEAANALADKISVDTVNFHHRVGESQTREAFIHAKWYAFEHADSYSVFLGSANCSKAALTIPGTHGNAELMALVSLPKEEFEANFIAEIDFLEVDPQLAVPNDGNIREEAELPSLLVYAARLDQGCLQVAYAGPPRLDGLELVVDGRSVDHAEAEPGVIVANGIASECRQVLLRAGIGGDAIQSSLHWVDHEQALSTTARRRSVVDAVRTKVQPQSWSIGAWSDIANVFLCNLQYLPTRMATMRGAGTGSNPARSGQVHYTAEDVFSENYSLPIISPLTATMMTPNFDDRVTSLRQLLMRWFGYNEEVEGEPSPGESDPDDGDDDVVDRPEKLSPTNRKPSPPPRAPTESDRRRALDMLKKVAVQMSSEAYLLERAPATIPVDIQFASVLLRCGLCEGWITESEFFAATHQIWTPLFFTSAPESACGWLQYRYKTAEDPEDFARKLASPKLTAALAAWAFAIPEGINTPEHGRFYLTKLLAVARLPWLWHYDDSAEVARELHGLLVSSTDIQGDRFWEETEGKWVSMMRCGHALRHLEEALAQATPAELKGRITQQYVKKGELLWQGTGGLCVATEDFDRFVTSANTTILYLQKTANAGVIRANFAIPMRSLLDGDLLPLAEAPRKVLSAMLADLSIGAA